VRANEISLYMGRGYTKQKHGKYKSKSKQTISIVGNFQHHHWTVIKNIEPNTPYIICLMYKYICGVESENLDR
jgi:hypothetical protein